MKKRKYKIGDKVILIDNPRELGESNKFYKDKVYKITDIKIAYQNNTQIINSLDNLNCCLVNTRFEYYYEKSLDTLSTKIFISTSSGYGDYNIIKKFIEKEETLTHEELKQCALIWEKYNKNER